MQAALASPHRIKRRRLRWRRAASARRDYNYFRDYEPGTGRYIESDPIGLRGGISTYAYVFAQPLRLVDRRGLEIPCGDHYCGTSFPYPWEPLKDDRPKECWTEFSIAHWGATFVWRGALPVGAPNELLDNFLPEVGVGWARCCRPKMPCGAPATKAPAIWISPTVHYMEASLGIGRRAGISTENDETVCFNYGFGLGPVINYYGPYW